MKVTQLTCLGFYLNGAQGTRKYDYMSIEIIKEKIYKDEIFNYLHKEMNMDVDTTMLSAEEKEELNKEWIEFASGIDEARKFCVDKGGLCLLVSYILESIQRLCRNK